MINYPADEILRMWDAADMKTKAKSLDKSASAAEILEAWSVLDTKDIMPSVTTGLKKPPPKPYEPPVERDLAQEAVPTKMPWQESGEGVQWIKDQVNKYLEIYGKPGMKNPSPTPLPLPPVSAFEGQNIGKLPGKAMAGAKDFIQGFAGQAGLDYKNLLPEDKGGTPSRSALAPPVTPRSFLQEKGEAAMELGAYMPKTATEFAVDPPGFVEERTFEAVALLAATAPMFKPAIKAWAKKAGINLPKDFFDSTFPGLSTKDVSKKKPTKAKEVPETATIAAPKKGQPMSEEYKAILGRVSEGKVDISKPGMPGDVFAYKEGTDISVSKKQIREMTNPKTKDLDMGTFEEAFTPTISIRRQYPFLNERYYDIAAKKKAALVHKVHVLDKTTKPFRAELKSAGESPKTQGNLLGQYLTGEQTGGQQILDAMGLKKLSKADMPANVLAHDVKMRTEFDIMHGALNKMRAKIGKKPLDYVENYMPWMRNVGALEEAGISLVTGSKSRIASHMEATAFKHAHKRRMHQGRAVDVPIEMNAYDVFDAYMNTATHHLHLSPAVARVQALLDEFELPTGALKKTGEPAIANWKLADSKPNLASWTQDWIDYVAGKSDLPTMKWKRKMHIAASKINKNQASAVLSFNVRSAAIQPSALKGAYALTNEASFLNGIKNWLENPEYRAQILRKSDKIITRNLDIHASNVGKKGSMESFFGGKLGRKHEALMDRDFFRLLSDKKRMASEWGIQHGLQYLDTRTASMSYAIFEYHAKNTLKMKDPKKIKRYCDDGVTRTQASGDIMDVAPVQRSAIGRLATLYQTYTINDWDMMLRDVVGYKGPKLPPEQRIAKVMRYIIATEAIGWISEGLIGIESPGPSISREIYEGVRDEKSVGDIATGVVKEAAEALPVIGGSLKWATAYRTPMPAAIQLPIDIGRVVTKLINRDIDKINNFDIEALGKALGIPGSTQVRKYLSRRKRGMNHLDSILGVLPEAEKKSLKERSLKSGEKAGYKK